MRPPWLAKRRAAADDLDRIAVSFTRDSLLVIADANGFARTDSGWFYGPSAARLSKGAGWQAIEGQTVVRVDHPDAAPGEPPYAFDNQFHAIARFELADGCALVLDLIEVGHVGEEDSADSLWHRLRLTTRRSRR